MKLTFLAHKLSKQAILFLTLLFICWHNINTCYAQMSNTQTRDPIAISVQKQNAIQNSSHRSFAQTSIFKIPLGVALYFYQNVLSEAFQTSCPHYPSCSGFAKDALTHFHLVKALALSADRLSRCTPLGLNDYDENELNYFNDLILDPVNDY